jgi:DNA-directed RNA polymerase subunit K/omega
MTVRIAGAYPAPERLLDRRNRKTPLPKGVGRNTVPRPFRDLFMTNSLPTQLVHQVCGSFELTSLLQKRVRELVRGQKPLFETRERNYVKIASEELRRGLIQLVADEEQEDPTLAL